MAQNKYAAIEGRTHSHNGTDHQVYKRVVKQKGRPALFVKIGGKYCQIKDL